VFFLFSFRHSIEMRPAPQLFCHPPGTVERDHPSGCDNTPERGRDKVVAVTKQIRRDAVL